MDNELPLQGPDKMITPPTHESVPHYTTSADSSGHWSRLEAGVDTALDWAGTRYSEVQNGNIVKHSECICLLQLEVSTIWSPVRDIGKKQHYGGLQLPVSIRDN